MAIATLSAPLTLDPEQAVTLKVENALLEFDARTVTVTYLLIDSSGKVLKRDTISTNAATVQTYVSNQESTIYNALLNKLGVTGSVA